MIGILGAMAPEVASLKARLTDAVTETVAGMEFAKGMLAGKPVVVARCGIGKVCAGICVEIMRLRYGVDTVINTGVAGALEPSLSVYDIVVADRLVQWDVDTSALGDPVGYLSEIRRVEMPCSPHLVEGAEDRLRARALPFARGAVASGDKFVADVAEKQRLRRDFDAYACEMEGGAVAQAAIMNGMDFLVLRAISDTAGAGSAVEYPVFVKKAAAVMADFVADWVASL